MDEKAPYRDIDIQKAAIIFVSMNNGVMKSIQEKYIPPMIKMFPFEVEKRANMTFSGFDAPFYAQW